MTHECAKKRPYMEWNLDKTPLWKKLVDELGIGGAVWRDEEVLRVRARLPHVGEQGRILARLLYAVNENIEGPAAVMWENEDPESNIQKRAMALCPKLNAVLEFSFYAKKRPLLRRHSVKGGTPGGALHLANSQFQTFNWWGGSIRPMNEDQLTLFRCAAELLPELPVATERSI